MGKTDMIELFPEVNKKKKRLTGLSIFFNHTIPKMERYAHQSITDIKSPTISDMPKANHVGNSAEETIYKHLYAQEVLKRTIEAIENCSNISKMIISKLYFTREKPLDWQIMKQLHYHENRYYFYKNRAFLEFADAYLLEDLHVFINSK